MKHKKNKSGIPVIILLLGVALIVVGSIFATSYLYTKEKYAVSNKAYSYSLIRKLDENSSDYKTAKKFYSEEEWNAIRNNKLNITEDTNSSEKIDENGKSLNKIFSPKKRADYNRILLDCPVGNSTVMYNVDNLGKFEVPNIRKRNDDALWLQILKKEKFIYGMTDILMKYRVRSNSISSNKFSLIKYHWQLYRNIEHLSVIRSVFHICWWGMIKILHIK